VLAILSKARDFVSLLAGFLCLVDVHTNKYITPREMDDADKLKKRETFNSKDR